MDSSSCDNHDVFMVPMNLSTQREKVRATLDNVFDGPRNGIQRAFELLLSMLENQQIQHAQLLNDHESLKKTWHTQTKCHQEHLEYQVIQIKQDFQLQIKVLQDEVKSLRESSQVDTSTIHETDQSNQLRFCHLEEKMDILSINFGILQESLIGGTHGEGGSMITNFALKSKQLNSDRDIDFHTQEEFLVDTDSPPRTDSSICTNFSPCGDNDPQGDPSQLIEDDNNHNCGSKQHKSTADEAVDHEYDKLCIGATSSYVTQQDLSGCDTTISPPLLQPSIIFCDNRSSSTKVSTEGSSSDNSSDTDENAWSNDELSRKSSDDTSSKFVEKVARTQQSHDQAAKRRETIRSNAVNVINTIYESVRLKRLSNEIPPDSRFASSANGVIVHLLDQEKIIEREIQALSTRIDTLTDSLQSNLSSCAPIHHDHPSFVELKTELNENLAQNRGGDSVLDLESKLSNLSIDIDSRVQKTHFRFLINIIYQALKNDDIPSDQSDEDTIQDIIHALSRRNDEHHQKQSHHVENLLNNFKDSMWTGLHSEIASRDVFLKESVDILRQTQTECKNKNGEGVEDSQYYSDYSTVDEKIKLATDTMQKSIRDLISSNLGQLAFIEQEVAKLTLQLAERPDDLQMSKMIQDLDYIVSGKIGKTEIFESILDSMKQGKFYHLKRKYVNVMIKIFP